VSVAVVVAILLVAIIVVHYQSFFHFLQSVSTFSCCFSSFLLPFHLSPLLNASSSLAIKQLCLSLSAALPAAVLSVFTFHLSLLLTASLSVIMKPFSTVVEFISAFSCCIITVYCSVIHCYQAISTFVEFSLAVDLPAAILSVIADNWFACPAAIPSFIAVNGFIICHCQSLCLPLLSIHSTFSSCGCCCSCFIRGCGFCCVWQKNQCQRLSRGRRFSKQIVRFPCYFAYTWNLSTPLHSDIMRDVESFLGYSI